MNTQTQARNILAQAQQLAGDDLPIGICSYSGDVEPGDIFVADGDGLGYVADAIQNGAVLVVCREADDISELEEKYDSLLVPVSDFKNTVSVLLNDIYGSALENIKLIGVTGTNGKTSTSIFSCGLLNNLGLKAGYIGTMGYGVYGESFVKGRNTTPDQITLKRYISKLHKKQCEVVVAEVSSHGIALDRISDIDFHIGVFTNLSRDHLDFHGTMDAYKSVKKSFFTDKKDRIAVINHSDEVGREIIADLKSLDAKNLFSYGTDRSDPVSGNDYHCIDVKEINHGYVFEIKGGGHRAKSALRIYGEYQIENVMAAVGVCCAMGYPLDEVAASIKHLQHIPGRMEYVHEKGSPAVYIDFAHSPESISRVAGSVQKAITWCVFGSGGDRDRGKRPLMGMAASEKSAHTIVCDDNVRTESAEQIIIDILHGVKNKLGVTVCRDRSKAICHAINKADVDDVILCLGKGDEVLTDYGDTKLSVKDVDLVKQCLEVA